MIYLSAGHHKKDSGAIANGYKESDLTIRIRDRIASHLRSKKIAFVMDNDSETLSEYLSRIKPGSGSVLLEIHLDAGMSSAMGTTALVPKVPNAESREFAKELAETTSKILGIKNRGVMGEEQSNRGRLAIMREPAGIICLLEVCFITNEKDLQQLLDPKKFDELCKAYADILVKYEKMKN